jgi:hypothetical protein
MNGKIKVGVVIVSIFCAVLLITPACSAGLFQQTMKKKNPENKATSQSQHWALLFAVGVYLNNPDADRPEMLEACDDLYDTLIDSPGYWQPDHIHTVKGSQATGQNLIKELLWLKNSASSEDYVVVYITTHGSPLRDQNGLPLDLPPKDEADGADELLVMYQGFDTWYSIIWDDLLNFFLSMIKCKGMCLIVDSCYSGGFNDPPMDDMNMEYNAASFQKGFMQDVSAQGRVVLMSTQENTLSYGSIFANYLTLGFTGWADFFGNNDGINSAEEAFGFAQPMVQIETGGDENPTIYDGYPGEFPITT